MRRDILRPGLIKAGRLIVVLMLTVFGAMAAAGTAHADHNNGGVTGTSFVDGADALTDDWGDHYAELGNSLCNGCADSNNTDLVIMWQAILYAEGLLPKSGIDGQFGPSTEAATRTWQGRHQIGVDGSVGNQTWTKADDSLEWVTSNIVRYQGWNQSGTVDFLRGSATNHNGAYQLLGAEPNGVGNDSASFSNSSHRIQFYSETLSVS
ncbi:peptidoglycan-binding domain-containing protein [Streptomyces aureus]